MVTFDTKIKIKKVGTLKYNRLKSISILRKELSSFIGEVAYDESRQIIDSLLSGNFDEEITLVTQYSLDKVFDNMVYDRSNLKVTESNFVWPWVAPIG
jgi:hypothetical protein